MKIKYKSIVREALKYNRWIGAVALPLCVAACAPLQDTPAIGLVNDDAGAVAAMSEQNTDLFGADAQNLNAAERRLALAAEYQALEHKKTGDSVEWGSEHGSVSGYVTPGQPYRVGAQNCRQYSHNWRVRGVPYAARGSACRNEDGSWTPLL